MKSIHDEVVDGIVVLAERLSVGAGLERPEFGGYGNSGYGREKGREALWNHVQTKNVAIKLRN